MVVRRKKKSRYMRGSRTYGWGRVGQHRKSGDRGGRGNVGYGKHKWTWTVKDAPDWYGKHGFTRHPSLVIKYSTINVGELDEISDSLIEKGLAKVVDDTISIDLRKLGINKLLGSGRVNRKYSILVYKASREASHKIEGMGGEVKIIGESV